MNFLSTDIGDGCVQFSIDTQLFAPTVAMKAAYVLLDRAYFFFALDGAILTVRVTPKAGQTWDATRFALEYSDELLSYALRVQIETENKTVRETIVRRALGSYADLPNFTSVEPSQGVGQIDFDKDIDEILREIESDPELKIDEAEIARILAEIELENQTVQKPKIDPNKLKNVKKNFQHT